MHTHVLTNVATAPRPPRVLGVKGKLPRWVIVAAAALAALYIVRKA